MQKHSWLVSFSQLNWLRPFSEDNLVFHESVWGPCCRPSSGCSIKCTTRSVCAIISNCRRPLQAYVYMLNIKMSCFEELGESLLSIANRAGIYKVISEQTTRPLEPMGMSGICQICHFTSWANTYHHEQLMPTVKHSGAMVMIWVSFAGTEPGQVIESTMKSSVHQRSSILTTKARLKLVHANFYLDNGPKHTTQSPSEWIKNDRIKVRNGSINI